MKQFSFSTTPTPDLPPPLWPDFNPQSEWSQRMLKAKSDNGLGFWDEMRAVFAHDLETLPKNRFKVWASVWNVPLMSMNRFSEYIRIVLTATMQPVYREALVDRGFGMAQRDGPALQVFFDFPTTMNRVQAMAHFIVNGWTPDKLKGLKKIVELGGGIGDMCDIAYRLGFDGEYVIYDLPEVGQIQKYYMDQLGNTKVKFTSDVRDLEDSDLVIGTWSFTEFPIALREKVLDQIGKSSNWLLAYSNKIFGIDNNEYINGTFVPFIEQNLKDGKVQFVDIPFMPWDGGAKYLSITSE